MAKLRKKQQRARRASTRSSRSEGRTTDSAGPRALPVTHEQSAFDTQRLRYATDHDRPRPDDAAPIDSSTAAPAMSKSATLQLPKTEVPRKPSPLRMSQQAAAEADMEAAGPSVQRG